MLHCNVDVYARYTLLVTRYFKDMTVRTFIIGSLLAGIISWSIWIAIIILLDPVQAGWLGFILFFLALFLAVASTVALIGYAARRLMAPEQLAAYAVRSALRQGALLALFLLLLLFLQLMRLYQWWLAVVAIVLFISVELMFLGYDRTTYRTNQIIEE